MAFRKDLDHELSRWEIESEGTTLRVSVYSYNGGEAKLQIGPRVYEKKDGSEGFRKAGRLTVEEATELARILPEALKSLEGGETEVSEG